MTLELITMQELLRDPQYRAFFTKVPKLPDHITPEQKPWKLIILKQGETTWRSKRFGTYQEAFKGFKKMLPVSANAAINCPSLDFMPPIKTYRVKGKINPKTKKPILKSVVWKPRIDGDMEHHDWCPYCRRPSIFRVAVLKPRNSNGYSLSAAEPTSRCIICGASERLVNLRRPENAQRWDANRPKVY